MGKILPLGDLVENESQTCKICQLKKLDPKMYEDMHTMILYDNKSHNSVKDWANRQIDLYNVARTPEEKFAIDKFNNVNFHNHFSKHLSKNIVVRAKMRGKLLGKRDNTFEFPEAMAQSVATSSRDSLDEIAEYRFVSDLVTSIEKKLMAYDDFHKEQAEKIQRKPSLQELQIYVELVTKLTDLKMRVQKLRNSSVVAGLAIQEAVTQSVKTFLDQAVIGSSNAEEILVTNSAENTALYQEVFTNFRTELAETLKSSIPNIVSTVLEQYSIKG